MKKLILIAAVAALSTPALASKARVSSLGNAEHLVDIQKVFENPAYNNLMSDYATFEMGPATTSATTAGAEGGFARSSGDAKYMMYLGRKSEGTTALRSNFGFLGIENSLEAQYAKKGEINWGAGFTYSSSDKKATTPPAKQNAMGVRFGAVTDVWEASASVGLGAKATGLGFATGAAGDDDADATMTGLMALGLKGAYKMENIYLYATYGQESAKFENAVNPAYTGFNDATLSGNTMSLGVIDHNKMEGGQWFYGVAYQTSEAKVDGAATAANNTKTTSTQMPFLLGLEYDLNTWLTGRASVTQNVLIGSTKTDPNDANTIGNNTTVAAGLGFKMNKWIVDGSWEASNSGNVNTTNFLTNASLTYTF